MNFETILKATQKDLKLLLTRELKSVGYKPVAKDGFVYAKGTVPVLLVAHMDTVHSNLPKIICYSEDRRFIMSPYGIGGDDRCGIYMIMEIVQHLKCNVLFTEDEEIGGIGATKFIKSNIKPEVNYIIEFDRQGENDCVFYNNCNIEFQSFIESFGFKTAVGSFSDISIIGPGLNISAVNLSSGYYAAHTKHEVIDTKVMENNIKKAINLIGTESSKFDFEDIYDIQPNCLYTQKINFVDDGYVILKNGAILDGYSYCIDKDKNVYEYDYLSNSISKIEGQAFNENGLPLQFDEQNAEFVPTLDEIKFYK